MDEPEVKHPFPPPFPPHFGGPSGGFVSIPDMPPLAGNALPPEAFNVSEMNRSERRRLSKMNKIKIVGTNTPYKK